MTQEIDLCLSGGAREFLIEKKKKKKRQKWSDCKIYFSKLNNCGKIIWVTNVKRSQ